MTVNWQLEPAASCPLHDEVKVKPVLAVAERIVSALGVGLFSVNVCGAAAVPTITAPKLALAGESVGGLPATPVQLKVEVALTVPPETGIGPD